MSVLTACLGSSTGEGEQINVTGTWAGEIRVALGADTLVGPAELTLEHAPNSDELSGTVEFPLLGNLEMIGESRVSSGEMVLVTRHDDNGIDDCHLSGQNWEFNVFPLEMRLRSVRGEMCEGDGAGGTSIRSITGGSGVLSRR